MENICQDDVSSLQMLRKNIYGTQTEKVSRDESDQKHIQNYSAENLCQQTNTKNPYIFTE